MNETTVLRPQPGARFSKTELWVALSLTGLILCFHVCRLVKAGGLWRDEAAVVQLATLPAFGDVASNFQHEAFPLLLPALVRGWASVLGTSDTAFRIFGLLVGVGIIGALWLDMYWVRRGVPLVSLALVGFNGAFVQWGDAVRGYGPGVLLMLLLVGLMWRVLERASWWRAAAALVVAVASVQCLFHNSVLLLAVCLGAAAVSIRREAERQTVTLVCVGTAAALSLLAYVAPLKSAREWDMLVRAPVEVEDLCGKLNDALSSSGWWNTWVWALLFLVGAGVAGTGQFRASELRLDRKERDVMLFAGLALVVGAGCYLTLLIILSYPTQAWYYMGLMGFCALLLDLLFDTLRQYHWARVSRLTVAVVLAASSLVPTLRQAQVRQTNIDLVAAELARAAGKDDFVVIVPWYNGISFSRYYHGSAPWTTVPALESHQFHRYDLVKAQMLLADQDEPVRSLMDQGREALAKGHKVWLAGVTRLPQPGEKPPNLGPAPNAATGWADEPYCDMWTMKVLIYLQACARTNEPVAVSAGGPVSHFEDVPLLKFEGWAGP